MNAAENNSQDSKKLKMPPETTKRLLAIVIMGALSLVLFFYMLQGIVQIVASDSHPQAAMEK